MSHRALLRFLLGLYMSSTLVSFFKLANLQPRSTVENVTFQFEINTSHEFGIKAVIWFS